MALIDKASLLMVPSTYEAGKLYNVLPSGNRAPDSTGENSGYDQTRADFDFDRGSNAAATRVNADGLIEKYRENLLLQSNQFDVSANWVNNSSTESSGFEGYDGTNNAWKLTATATSGAFIRQIISFSNIKTFSVYAKVGTSSHLLILTEGGGNTWFDLQNGIIETDAAILSNMESVGNDWYRCSVTWNSSITGVRLYVCDADGTSSVANGGYIYLQNAQLESGLVSTEYLESTSVTGKAGVLIDLPRIDYSSGAGALLLEPSRLNKIQYSEYFGDSSWNNSNEVTRSISGTTSPEGVLNAYDIIPTTANTNHTLRAPNLSGFTSGAVVNVSFFAKENGYKFISVVGGFGSSNTSAVVFNLEDGTIESGTGTIEDFGNGWYRCVSPITLNATALYCVGTILNDSQSGSFSGDGVKGISVYGYQIEEASYQTSYIPNHGESGGVTRAADSCSVTGASDVIGQSEGVVYFEWDYQNVGSSGGNIVVSLAGASLQELYFWVKTNGSLVYDVYDSTQQVGISGSIGSFGIKKVALAYKNNDFALYINGVLVGSDTSGSIPTLTDVYIGRYALNTNYNISSGIKQVALFNERLTNEELATLTTL